MKKTLEELSSASAAVFGISIIYTSCKIIGDINLEAFKTQPLVSYMILIILFGFNILPITWVKAYFKR